MFDNLRSVMVPRYQRVHLEAFSCSLAPVVVSSDELDDRLESALKTLRVPRGQLEALTGIRERRWWEPGAPLAESAAKAALMALERAGRDPAEIDAVLFTSVCREHFEPATACRVADLLGARHAAWVHDISNACLGVLSGIIDLANRIELGQIRSGVVIACESAREITERAITQLALHPTMENYRETLATLTGGSGAAAVVVGEGQGRGLGARLHGGVSRSDTRFNSLCRWGLADTLTGHPLVHLASGLGPVVQTMATDSVAVLRHGLELGKRTWDAFLSVMGMAPPDFDQVVCHQVGTAHRDAMLASFGLSSSQVYSTYPFLGNMGTAALPATVALADERRLLVPGKPIGLLGIGSGLNCLMLGATW
ncbi:MAG: 3-oxoacyl-ACP synthase III [Gemmataceae bacterium]